MESVLALQAPLPIGPYSQAIEYRSFIFCSGQIPLDPRTSDIVDQDIRVQTTQVLNNLKAILKSAGCAMNTVVKTTVFLQDMADFDAFNEVYATYFSEPYPARSCVQVAALPKNAMIEIEAIAVRY